MDDKSDNWLENVLSHSSKRQNRRQNRSENVMSNDDLEFLGFESEKSENKKDFSRSFLRNKEPGEDSNSLPLARSRSHSPVNKEPVRSREEDVKDTGAPSSNIIQSEKRERSVSPSSKTTDQGKGPELDRGYAIKDARQPSPVPQAANSVYGKIDDQAGELINSRRLNTEERSIAEGVENRQMPVAENFQQSRQVDPDGFANSDEKQFKHEQSRNDISEIQKNPNPDKNLIKSRPKSSSLWEKMKRKEQMEQQLNQRAFFEHAQPDFVDLTHEPNYGGDRDLQPNESKRTLYYSKKGNDASYIDVVAEVQLSDDIYKVQAYDEPEKPRISYSSRRAVEMRSNTRPPRWPQDDSILEFSQSSNSQVMRQSVYNEWLARKAAYVRAEQKKKQMRKYEDQWKEQELFKNKVMASKAAFAQWKKEKAHLIKEKKEQEEKRLEEEKKEKKKEDDAKSKIRTYSKWVAKDKRDDKEQAKLAQAEREAIERRKKAREEKQRKAEQEKMKKELGEKAFKKWEEEKRESAKKKHIDGQKARKEQKNAEFQRRVEKDQLASQSYQQWLENKEQQSLEGNRSRRASSAYGGSSSRLSARICDHSLDERPPWFPASRTVPRNLVRLT